MTYPQPPFAPFAGSFQSTAPSSAELGLLLLGPSTAMAQLWGQLRRLAPHVRTVLLTGEPDCGQQAVAHLLLDLSLHPRRSFVQLTAADAEARLVRSSGLTSLPTDLFLYLPDIDRFSIAAQEGLLRLMRMRRSRPFTVVASTSEDLRALAGLGRFSAALADALTSVRIALPPLRERPEDIPMLVTHLLTTSAHQAGCPAPRTTEEFLQAAMQHAWPGNLRELTLALTRLAQASTGRELSQADLRHVLAAQEPLRTQNFAPIRLVPLETIIQEHIGAVLKACCGNKLRASEVLGISRSTLYRMLDTAEAFPKTSLPLAS